MSRRALAVAVLVGALLQPAAARAADVRVTTSISPSPSRFGDVIHATVVARSSAALTVEAGFAPFQVVGESSARKGDVSTWRYDLQCLEAQCVPGPGARSVQPAAVRVRSGSSVVLARFPAVRIEPRASEAQVANPERSFLRPTTPPPPSFRFAPRTTQRVLIAAGAALALVALLLVVPLVRPRRVRAPLEPLDPLERALGFVQDARTRTPADRRRALGLLARVLRRSGATTTGQEAADLAWSEPEPDVARMTQLVDRIERVQ